MQPSEKPPRRFRYGFDQSGYYTGLIYPITEGPLGPIWPTHTTDREPLWKDGFYPRFNFEVNGWTLEPKGEKEIRLAVEKEIAKKLVEQMIAQAHLSDKFLTESLKELKSFIGVEIWQAKTSIQVAIDRIAELSKSQSERFDQLDQAMRIHGARISNMIQVMIESEKREIELLSRPNIFVRAWIKLKSYFKT